MSSIRIGATTYELFTIGSAKLPIGDVVKFRGQAKALGIDLSWNDVENLAGTPFADLITDDQVTFLMVTFWLTMRAAGEAVTLSQVADLDLDDFEFIADEPEAIEGAPFVLAPDQDSPADDVLSAVLGDE